MARRRGWVLPVVLGCVLVLVGASVGVYFGLRDGADVPAGAPPSAAGPALPSDPTQALTTLSRSDAAAAEALVGSWVPQLSAKKVGMVVDGQTFDAAAVLADHQRLRTAHPDALLVWSGDYTSFRGSDFWITLVGRAFPSGDAANAWCASAGLGRDDCYAKRLAHTGTPSGNTAMRTDAAVPATTTTGGAAPTLGAVWSSNQTGYGDVRPSEVNAGGDGTSVAWDVTWDSWGGPQATGRATASWVPPDGASSDGVRRPAVIVASDLGTCHGHPAYLRVGWYFPTEGETAVPPGNGYDEICP